MNGLFFLRKIIISMCLLGVSISVLAESGPEESESPPSLPESTNSSSAGAAYTVCLFKDKSGKAVEKWGLTPKYQWYSFEGRWIKTAYSAKTITKFIGFANYEDIRNSCSYAKAYYKMPNDAFAIFASKKGKRRGKRHPILLDSAKESCKCDDKILPPKYIQLFPED